MSHVSVRPDMLYAWSGSSLLVVNTRGECGDDEHLSGYYYREARFLRTLQFEIDQKRPWLCETCETAPDSLATVIFSGPTFGQEKANTDVGTIDQESVAKAFPAKPPYSPYAGRNWPTAR